MGIPSDRRFLAVARKRLAVALSRAAQAARLPQAKGPPDRDDRVADRRLCRRIPGFHDDLLLIDSTPVECARSVETTRRSALADAADYGYCASHSRFFWGFRLHGLSPPTALLGPSPSPLPSATSARSGSSCSNAPTGSAGRSSSATRATRAASSPRRSASSRPRSSGRLARTSRQRHPPRPDPPAGRVDLLDLQGHPHPGAPRRPHPSQPARSHRPALPGAGRMHRAQPQARSSKSRPGRLRRLRPWNQPSRRR